MSIERSLKNTEPLSLKNISYLNVKSSCFDNSFATHDITPPSNTIYSETYLP